MGREWDSIGGEKPTGAHIPVMEPEKTDACRDGTPEIEKPAPNVDHFGAAKKTDPVEIRLVKKLDMYIMVCLPRCLAVPPINGH